MSLLVEEKEFMIFVWLLAFFVSITLCVCVCVGSYDRVKARIDGWLFLPLTYYCSPTCMYMYEYCPFLILSARVSATLLVLIHSFIIIVIIDPSLPGASR